MFFETKNYSHVLSARESTEKLTKLELSAITVDNFTNIEYCSKPREIQISRGSLEILRAYEKCREEIAISTGFYKPRLSYKIGSEEQGGFIVAYDLYEFMDSEGRVVVPEGVGVIRMTDELVCRSIRLPKSLAVIVNLKIKCKGRVNLKNVRYISGLEVDVKEILLPYTVEYIANKGITLCGKTVLKSEKTPSGDYIRVGSLGKGAIVDNRSSKGSYFLSNRFVNMYEDSLGGGKLFREINTQNIALTEEMYIDKHYPDYLYHIKSKTKKKLL